MSSRAFVVKKTLKCCPFLGLRSLNLFLLTGIGHLPIAPIAQRWLGTHARQG
ncbi:MAG: hypothetical protein ICV80_02985 [Microcoleus sp. T1-bin1]|nr:hypothetical protein [Microcoleus sp. T1-bin1]